MSLPTKQHYENAVYWKLPDDGATFKCSECNKQFKHTEVILTQVPANDSRAVFCMECIDDDWLRDATNLGMFGE